MGDGVIGSTMVSKTISLRSSRSHPAIVIFWYTKGDSYDCYY